MSDDLFLKEIGNRLRMRRKEMNLTQSELVELLNQKTSAINDDYISDKQISRVESGHNYTRLDKFVTWCLILDKTPDYLLLGVDNGHQSKEDKISQICDYLKLCKDEDVENTLVYVKAMSGKNK